MACEARKPGSRAACSTPTAKHVVVWGPGAPLAHLQSTHTHTPRAQEDLIRAQRPISH